MNTTPCYFTFILYPFVRWNSLKSYFLPIFSLSALIYNPILDAIMMSRNYGLIFGAAARVFELLSLKSTVKVNENIGYKSIDNYEISFENVVFSYSKNGKRVFDDMSFEVKNVESVVLVGESGCGKSTIARLLSRFYEIDGGVIRIGNEDIKNYNIRQLRDIITVVPQESYLFNRSIKENILMAKENASVDDMEKAVESAQITDIIARMEDEKQSVGEKGSRLSGGERARVSLARAFIRNTPILILDEVSASLDSDNENKINKAVNELKKDRITIIIAHRLSTIKAADRIVLIKDGRVEDIGSYEELFDRSEYFRWLIGSEY